MRKNLQVFFVVALSLVAFSTLSSSTQAQRPSLKDLIQDVDQAAESQNESKSFLGFEKVKMPRPLEGLVDLRFKKPTLPKFGFIEKLKNFGKPAIESEPTTKGPFLASLGNLFSKKPKTTPGFFDRMFGRQSSTTPDDDLLSQNDMEELNGIARGLQSQAKRMSRTAQNNVRDLFSPSETPQPPYRTARQYQENSSRY